MIQFDDDTDSRGFKGPVWILILRTFFSGNRDNLEVLYVNGNPSDIRPENLRFTMEDIVSGGRRPVLCKEVDGELILDRRTRPPVRVLESGKVYKSAVVLAKVMDTEVEEVYKCLNGTYKSHMGRTIEYV